MYKSKVREAKKYIIILKGHRELISHRGSEVGIKLSCHGNRERLDVIKLRCVGILHDICIMISKVEETVHRVRTGLYSYKIAKEYDIQLVAD